ncbi:MAG: NAD(P)/FAD-dependent oxidoreductase [Rhizomicrobium sp.]
MSEEFDALVVGGGVEGLIAVSLLAKAGLRAQLLERSAILYGHAGAATLSALDPLVVRELRLARHGLKFAMRDLSLTALRQGGANAVIGRDRHATARSLAALSPADALAYAGFRRDLFALARALRPSWWEDRPVADTLAGLKPRPRALFERLSVSSACAFVAAAFESDALRGALVFAAADCGAAPPEAGSALALLWAASQEMSGLQGAVAIPEGGVVGLLRALSEAAQASGAAIRTGAAVARLTVAGGAATGVELATGEIVTAPLVLSALSRRRTLLDLLPSGEVGLGAARALGRPTEAFGAATLVFALSPGFDTGLAAGTRMVIAERLETYETALAAIRLGLVPREPVLELVMFPAGRTLTVRAWPVAPSYDRNALVRTVTAMIERHAAGFAQAITNTDVLEPPDGEPFAVARLFAGAAERIETPVRGLLLCGIDAEPAHALSGRAARQAAGMAVARHIRARLA